ncbi:chromate transporter [Acinetobacter baumannii]|uniref:chromate transporter n=1 Tax=Acinetobacter baumannii TaxID=470 RepID=UPI001CE0FC7B|nr:chromate transporter [Acinetobacter baumannii]UBX39182.1 chromate transporter [Acinetobacter baumannii]
MNHVEIAVQKDTVPTCTELFLGFLTLGLIGFGGVLPLARKVIVEQRHWLSPEKFTELLGLCQFLPGGNIINLSVAIGMEFRGVRGAVSSLIGLIFAPTVIVVLLHYVYEQFQDNLMVKHLFEGLAAAAAAGLLVATGLKMLKPLLRNPLAICVVVAAIVSIAFLKIPLLLTMLILLAFYSAIIWRRV